MSVAKPHPLLAEATRMVREAKLSYPGSWVWLYAIQAGKEGAVKIGVAKNPAERLATLQQGNPEKLRIIARWWDCPLVERWLHEEFASARLQGEWFQPTAELLDAVSTYHEYQLVLER